MHHLRSKSVELTDAHSWRYGKQVESYRADIDPYLVSLDDLGEADITYLQVTVRTALVCNSIVAHGHPMYLLAQ
jgi:hypothetical protein